MSPVRAKDRSYRGHSGAANPSCLTQLSHRDWRNCDSMLGLVTFARQRVARRRLPRLNGSRLSGFATC
jgi:hypothetical protein